MSEQTKPKKPASGASKDFRAGLRRFTIRFLWLLALIFPHIQGKYPFDVYRNYFLYVIAVIVGIFYGLFALIVIGSRKKKWPLAMTLPMMELIFVREPFRSLFMRPLPFFGKSKPGRAVGILFNIAVRAAAAIFFFAVIPSWVSASNFKGYAVMSAIFVAAAGLEGWRAPLERAKSTLSALAMQLIAAAFAGYVASGLPAAQAHLARTVAWTVCMYLGMAAVNYSAAKPRLKTVALWTMNRFMFFYSLFLLMLTAAFCQQYFLIFAFNAGLLNFMYYMPWLFGAIAIIAAGVVVFLRSKKKRGRNMFYYVIVVQALLQAILYVRIPPTQKECAAIPNYNGEVGPVLSFAQMHSDPNIKGLPYDSVYDYEDNQVLAALKNRAGRGTIVRIEPGNPDNVQAVSTFSPDRPKLPMYPERMQIDVKNKNFFVTAKSPGHFTLIKGSYGKDSLAITDMVDYGAEEITNVFLLPDHDLLAILYLPTPVPALRLVRPSTLEEVKYFKFEGHEVADYFEYDRRRQRMIMPAFSLVRSVFFPHLNYVDLKDLSSHQTAVPELKYKIRSFYGIAYNDQTDRIYLSSPISHQVVILDGETYEVVNEVPTGDHIRKLALAERNGLLFIPGFGDSSVDVMDTRTEKIIRTYKLGPQARSATVDPVTERAFASTGCGVFEMKPDRANTFPVNRPYRLLYTEYLLRLFGQNAKQ